MRYSHKNLNVEKPNMMAVEVKSNEVRILQTSYAVKRSKMDNPTTTYEALGSK